MPSIVDRVKKAWDVFRGRDPTSDYTPDSFKLDYGPSYSYRSDKFRPISGTDRTLVTAIYERIAIDVSGVELMHAKMNENGQYVDTIYSDLNKCLNLSANVDQTGRAFIQDLVMSMFDEGVVAVVPTYTDIDPRTNDAYKIYEMRIARIKTWFPKHVRVELYDDNSGRKREVVLPKKSVGIIENPFYAVMNDRNSVAKQIIRKMSLMESIDEQAADSKLDLIIQLPYVIRSDKRRKEAEERRKDVEQQLAGSKYGVAYTDGTEKVIQLNRSLENNLLKTVEYLMDILYSQLGVSKAILDGTASEQEMLNYRNNTLEPVLSAIANEFTRKFLTSTAITQKQAITYIQQPFKLVPASQVAEIADKFSRNAVLSANEIRSIIGYKPVDDQKADELRNNNLNAQEGETFPVVSEDGGTGNAPEQAQEAPNKLEIGASIAKQLLGM